MHVVTYLVGLSSLNFPGDGGAIGPAFNTVDNSKGTGDADQYPPLPFE